RQVLEPGHRALVADLAAELARLVRRLVEQVPGRIDRRILERVGDEATKHVARAAEEGLDRERAATEVIVGQRGRKQLGAVRGEIARLHAARAAGGDAERAVARNEYVVAVAFQLEAVGDHFQARARAELIAEAAEHRPGITVLHFALGAV